MKNRIVAHAIGIPISSVAYPTERSPKKLLYDHSATQYHIPSSSNGTLMLKQNKAERMNKFGGRANSLVNCIREHVRLGPKISETVKGKLSLWAKIVKAGGVEKIFKRNFSVREGDKLLKVSQCYLSTTAGPIAGLLFISIDKLAFCSERSIKLSSPNGEFIRIHYKVLIPIGKILRANESQTVKSHKYIELITVDNFDFWFMGFLNYRKTFKYLQQALSQAQ